MVYWDITKIKEHEYSYKLWVLKNIYKYFYLYIYLKNINNKINIFLKY
jgi:hypothetical protein